MIPYGLCQCGCGEKTKLHTDNKSTKGYVKGEPRKFIRGHSKWGNRNLEHSNLICRKCNQELPTSEFYIRRQGKIKKYHSYCKFCVGTYNREIELKIIYELTLKQYNSLLEQQNNSCAICLETFKEKDKYNQPCVDHCHVTGKVRGILCTRCNVAIGQLKEDTNILQQAIKYLQQEIE